MVDTRKPLTSFRKPLSSFVTKEMNVTPEQASAVTPYRDLSQQPGLTTPQQVAAGATKFQYRNVEETPNFLTKVVRSTSNAAPVIGSTVAGTIGGLVYGDKGRSVASGAGFGAGQALGESLENLAGIQNETPGQLAQEAVVKPLATGAADYAIGKTIDAGVAGTKAIAGTALKGVKKITPEIIKKPLRSLVKGVPKTLEDDVIAQLKPTKSIRKEARTRGINIVDEVVNGGYGDDAIENAAMARENIKATGQQYDKVLTDFNNRASKLTGKAGTKYTTSLTKTVDAHKAVDEVASELKRSFRKTEQKNAIADWANFLKTEHFPEGSVDLIKANQEKVLAGQSGYKGSGEVVSNLVGQADALLERKLREGILKAAPKQIKQQLEDLLKRQEANIFLESLFENAADSNVPLTISASIGRYLNPISAGRATVGAGTEYLGRELGRPLLKEAKRESVKGTAKTAGNQIRSAVSNVAAPTLIQSLIK